MNYMLGMPDLRICLRLNAHSKSVAFGMGAILCSMWIGLVCPGGIRTPGEMCSTWTGRMTGGKRSIGCTLTDRGWSTVLPVFMISWRLTKNPVLLLFAHVLLRDSWTRMLHGV